MRRITLSLDDKLADPFDQWAERHGNENRSEAFRDLLRGWLENERIDGGRASHCVATVSYVYNAMRLRTLQAIRRPPTALPALHSS